MWAFTAYQENKGNNVSKKMDAFLKRTKLSTKISKECHNKGKLFETFSMKPQKPNVGLFLNDFQLIGICESSLYSLQYVNLTSCNLLTQRSFDVLAKCKCIQHLSMKNNSFLTDRDALNILQNLQNLTKLSLSGCSALTDATIETIASYCPKLDKLELAANSKMGMSNLFQIVSLKHLIKLNLRASKVTADHLMQILRSTMLSSLNVESCNELNDTFMLNLCESPLRFTLTYLNVKNNRQFTEEGIWAFVSMSNRIVQLGCGNDLFSDRIQQKLYFNSVQISGSSQ